MGGDLKIKTNTLVVKDGAKVSTSTFAGSKGGNLTIDAKDIQLIGTSKDGVFLSGLFAEPFSEDSKGGGGDLTIKTNTLLVKDGAQVSTNTFGASQGGNLTINAKDIQLIGTSKDGFFPSGLFAEPFSAEPFSEDSKADGGDLTIKTNTLLVKGGAKVSTRAFLESKGGNLTIDAKDIQILGTSKDGSFRSGLYTEPFSEDLKGTGGDLTINTNKLLVKDGAQVSGSTFGASQASNLIIDAKDIQLIGEGKDDNSTGLFTKAESGTTGDAKNLFITTDRLLISNGATISVTNDGTGAPGDININAGSVKLDNGKIEADTNSNKKVGNIKLDIADLLLMRNGSRISTNAGVTETKGNGGNITINIPDGFIIATPNQNSDITANASEGNGGRVNINATGIFGIAPLSSEQLSLLRPKDLEPGELPTNDITAVSQQNSNLSGTIEIDVPENPTQEQEELQTDIVDVSRLIEQNLCQASQNSEFVITGRGGIPQSPKETLETDAGWEDWRLIPFKEKTTAEIIQKVNKSEVKIKEERPKKIVQAQGVTFNSNGEVVLTATPNSSEPLNSGLNALNCHNFAG